jgi:hypothetical protein
LSEKCIYVLRVLLFILWLNLLVLNMVETVHVTFGWVLKTGK